MKTISNTFDPTKVTYSSDIDTILTLWEQDKLFDFLERIYPEHYTQFSGKKVLQKTILDTWTKHFDELSIPYAITSGTTRVGKYLVLWKEKRL